MLRYETLILAVPEITADETTSLESQFEAIIKKANGSIRSFERWGKYKLAYSVWNNEYGVYFLARFDLEKDVAKVVKEIEDLFKVRFPNVVMRHMNSRLPENAPLTYIKPDSLEDLPSQDVDTFLRENNMKGLLQGGSGHGAAEEQDFNGN